MRILTVFMMLALISCGTIPDIETYNIAQDPAVQQYVEDTQWDLFWADLMDDSSFYSSEQWIAKGNVNMIFGLIALYQYHKWNADLEATECKMVPTTTHGYYTTKCWDTRIHSGPQETETVDFCSSLYANNEIELKKCREVLK